MTENYNITKGSKYSVSFGRSENVTGTFKGYSIIGSETALVLDVDNSVMYIPINKILSMKLIGPSAEPAAKKKEDPGAYYA